MNGLTGKALSVGLAAALLMTGGQAYAQGACGDTTVSAVVTPGFSCTMADKTFSNFTITGAPSTGTVDFGQLGPLFAVTLGRGNAFFPAGTTVFDFMVTAAAPNVIRMGSVGIDVSFGTVTTTTLMNGLSVVPGSPVTFTPGVGSVMVDNTSHIGSISELNSISNDFSQVVISTPEPASLSLFGLGLFGLGLARRRRS